MPSVNSATNVSSGVGQGKIGRLCSLLRKDIIRGRYKPGAPLPSTGELSRDHGVAEATASAAVRHLAHEGLAIRVRGQGSFVPKDLPPVHKSVDVVRFRDMAGKKNGTHALKWIEEFTETSSEQGWTARWHHVSNEKGGSIGQIVDRFPHSEGVITLFEVSPSLPMVLCRQEIPVVAVFLMPGGMGDRPEPYPQITYDRRESARLATEHLVSLDYSRIGFIGLKFSPMRTVGFIEAVGSHQISVKPKWLINLDTDVHRENGPSGRLCKELVQRALQERDRPQAFCCSSLRTAYAVVHAAEELGVKVPEDLAVVACDEADPDTDEALAITAVAVSRREVCGKAIELLEQLCQQGTGGDTQLWTPTVMPLHLSIADSCGAKRRERAK